jgi:hypothetical protein
MRNLKFCLSAVALAGLANFSLAAQQPSQSPSPSGPSQSALVTPDPASQTAPTQPAPANAAPVQSTANSPEASNAQLRPVEGELEKKLDAKHARPGDPVVLKTTDKATIANGVIIPKGSKIVGHVVEAAAAGKGNANSKVTLQFDRAKLKGGQSLAIRTVLQSVAPESSSATTLDLAGPSGGAPMAAPPSAQSDATAQAGMAHGINASAGNSAAVAGTVVARQGNVSIMTTAIPGVLIGASADGKPFSNAAGVLLGARQNVRLVGGTHIVLAVADAGAKPTNSR